jgi:hypothetical protein
MLKRLLALLTLCLCMGSALLVTSPAQAADDITVVYLGTDDCPYCRHWEARAKDELLASPERPAFRYVEVRGETLRQPIVERHYPEELKWLGRRLGPSRGVPRFILVINGEVAWSVFGTNNYEKVFLPALREAVARSTGRT